MGGEKFHRLFLIRVYYLFHYIKFFNTLEIHQRYIFQFQYFHHYQQIFLSLHSWFIFLTSGTLYSTLRMSSLFSHSRNGPLKSYHNKTTKRKCVTLSCLKFFLLRSFCVPKLIYTKVEPKTQKKKHPSIYLFEFD